MGRNIDFFDNLLKMREILSFNEIFKYCNVYSLLEINILFVEVIEFKGIYL